MGYVSFHLKYWLKLTYRVVASTCMLPQRCWMTSRLKIECRQLHSELFGRRHSTLQLHGLFALAMLCLNTVYLAQLLYMVAVSYITTPYGPSQGNNLALN